jgi:hypothetical protein
VAADRTVVAVHIEAAVHTEVVALEGLVALGPDQDSQLVLLLVVHRTLEAAVRTLAAAAVPWAALHIVHPNFLVVH